MKKQSKSFFIAAAVLLTAFVGWTALVCLVDVRPIGPDGSTVGMSSLNGCLHGWMGVHPSWYILTDWLGLVPIAIAFGFAMLGLVQWIKRKSPWRVDADLLVLGGFYLAVILCYLFFEMVTVNYRPIKIDGITEASYPSSTTLLAVSVSLTAMIQARGRIRSLGLRRVAEAGLLAFASFMVVGRVISGVHWPTDIVGGLLLGIGLSVLYAAVVRHIGKG